MTTEHISISDEDGVRRIVIARPDKKNALTNAMYGAMTEAVREATRDTRHRCVVFAAEGDVFTSGNDLNDFVNFSFEADGREPPSVIQFLHAIAETDVALVAAVQGPAVGIGVTMLLHCDYVLAADGATFKTPFIDLGLTPEGGSSLIMPDRFGAARASELLLLGRKIDAARAELFGVINEVVAPDDLQARASDIAAAFAAKAPDALRQAKRLLRGDGRDIVERINAEARIFADRLQSDEFKEAAAAFLEKRPPNFSK